MASGRAGSSRHDRIDRFIAGRRCCQHRTALHTFMHARLVGRAVQACLPCRLTQDCKVQCRHDWPGLTTSTSANTVHAHTLVMHVSQFCHLSSLQAATTQEAYITAARSQKGYAQRTFLASQSMAPPCHVQQPVQGCPLALFAQ